MAHHDDRTPHWAVEEFERRYWPRGTDRGKGPRNYKRSRERILDDVAEALTREPELDAGEITVEVNDERDVILGGTVTHRPDKRLAEDLVADVFGVRDVHNDIRVVPGR